MVGKRRSKPFGIGEHEILVPIVNSAWAGQDFLSIVMVTTA